MRCFRRSEHVAPALLHANIASISSSFFPDPFDPDQIVDGAVRPPLMIRSARTWPIPGIFLS